MNFIPQVKTFIKGINFNIYFYNLSSIAQYSKGTMKDGN